MGRITNLIGIIKDKASQSKAILILNPKTKTLSFNLSVLRATTHDPSTPPGNRHLSDLLAAGNGSRATAGSAVEAIMDRLHMTKDACVALKCLIIVHHIVKHGRFILQDQLSIFPVTGGRNYLKLSGFRDEKSVLMWELSSWVRWYASYLEHLLTASRTLGFFISSTHKDNNEETLSSHTNTNLLHELNVLNTLLEEACKIPDLPFSGGQPLTNKITHLIGEDFMSLINELYMRLNEFKERLKTLSFGDSIELVYDLKRVLNCREKLSQICHANWKKAWIDEFWSLVCEINGVIGKFEGNFGRNLKLSQKSSESARFSDRLFIGYGSDLRFGSGRFSNVDRFN